MLRAVSALVLALFVAGPGVRARCLLLCTKTNEASTATSRCHEQPAAGATIGALHSCATTAPVLTAFKSAGTDTSTTLAVPAPDSTARHASAIPDPILHSPPGSPPPSPPLLIPLRI